MDASSVGPLNEGLGLEGRLKYFLRLLRWSLLGTAAGSGRGPSGSTPLSGASSEVLGISSFPGPGRDQLAAGVHVISSFDSSGERGFLGLPHFWHEGPHVPRRNAGSRREGPATTISGTGATSCEIRSGDGLLWALVTTGCSVVTHGEVGKFGFVPSGRETFVCSRFWGLSRTALSEWRCSWLVRSYNV